MAAEAQGPAADQLPLDESDAADLQLPAAAEAAAVDLPVPPAAAPTAAPATAKGGGKQQ